MDAVTVPDAALPTRALLAGDEEFYLLGPSRLFASRDGGRTCTAVPGVPDTAEMTALTLVRVPQEVLIAVLDGRVVVSHDRGSHWRDGGLGERTSPVEMVAPEPSVPGRIWAALDGQIFMSDDLGSSWRALGQRLPELGTKVRGVASNHQTLELLVTTDRGTYRSEKWWRDLAFERGQPSRPFGSWAACARSNRPAHDLYCIFVDTLFGDLAQSS